MIQYKELYIYCSQEVIKLLIVRARSCCQMISVVVVLLVNIYIYIYGE